LGRKKGVGQVCFEKKKPKEGAVDKGDVGLFPIKKKKGNSKGESLEKTKKKTGGEGEVCPRISRERVLKGEKEHKRNLVKKKGRFGKKESAKAPAH